MIEYTESFQHSNIDESDMGQLHGAIDIHLNAIASVRRKMSSGPSREACIDCGEEIPVARRLAVQGCLRFISCQRLSESS